MKWNFKGKFTSISLAIALSSLSSQVFASDFNENFINASQLGSIYSGYAAEVPDASTAISNPAGLALLHHTQLTGGFVNTIGSSHFTGSSSTPPFAFPGGVYESGMAGTDLKGFLPNFYISLPISNRATIAFGESIPFALGTDYGKYAVTRYAATRTQIIDIDVGPSIGFSVTDKIALGVGLDVNRLIFRIENMVGPPTSTPNAESQNHLYGWGLGWHGGILFTPKECTRIGLSFNSQVMYHTTGNSEYYMPVPAMTFRNSQSVNAALPARTQLSIYQDVTNRIALMGTIFYAHWSELQQLTLRKVALPGTTTSITIPFEYHNTFDYAIGGNFKITDKWMLKSGIDYFGSPSNNRDRNVSDPIGNAIIPAIGAHYQPCPCLGFDMGYAHAFFQNTHIGATSALTSLSGHSFQEGNVFGAQATWNIT